MVRNVLSISFKIYQYNFLVHYGRKIGTQLNVISKKYRDENGISKSYPGKCFILRVERLNRLKQRHQMVKASFFWNMFIMKLQSHLYQAWSKPNLKS